MMRLSLALIAMSLSQGAFAQRADENAVTQAEDAFGTSIGNESVGIYNSFDVRGFSPTRAGNARIEGLFFDQVWAPTSRIRRSTTIRVGISAQGFPFPAPTGVVDYAFRKPGNEAQLSVIAGGNSYKAASLEFDGVIPIVKDRLSLGVGLGLFHNKFSNGTNSEQHVEGGSLRWTPSPAVEIMPYWSRSDIYDDKIGPLYVPAGNFLPPRIKRRQFNGPDFAVYRGVAMNYGGIARVDLSPDWQLRAGLFRSLFDNKRDAFTFITDLTSDGRGNFLFFADPPNKLASTSGEVRLSRKFADGPRLHKLFLSVRARDRTNRNDGTDAIDLGPTRIGDRISVPRPSFNFSPQTRDRVQQETFGLAYEGRWRDVGELSFGVQKTRYRKRTDQPGLPLAISRSNPLLFNVAAAGDISKTIAVYGGYTRGLEESGIAPQNAANRNEGLPAIITTQRDIGLRWVITPEIKLIAGLFDVRKPYFNLDANNVFALLGDTKNQGIEVSLSGNLTKRLNIVAGGVLSRPRVTGEGVRLGRLGRLPVDQAARKVDFNIDWRPPIVDGLSLDLALGHSGRIIATRNNLVAIPARTLVDLGGRYAFKLGGAPASFRLSVSNVFNEYGFDLRGAGSYDLIDGRVASARLTVDF